MTLSVDAGSIFIMSVLLLAFIVVQVSLRVYIRRYLGLMFSQTRTIATVTGCMEHAKGWRVTYRYQDVDGKEYEETAFIPGQNGAPYAKNAEITVVLEERKPNNSFPKDYLSETQAFMKNKFNRNAFLSVLAIICAVLVKIIIFQSAS